MSCWPAALEYTYTSTAWWLLVVPRLYRNATQLARLMALRLMDFGLETVVRRGLIMVCKHRFVPLAVNYDCIIVRIMIERRHQRRRRRRRHRHQRCRYEDCEPRQPLVVQSLCIWTVASFYPTTHSKAMTFTLPVNTIAPLPSSSIYRS